MYTDEYVDAVYNPQPNLAATLPVRAAGGVGLLASPPGSDAFLVSAPLLARPAPATIQPYHEAHPAPPAPPDGTASAPPPAGQSGTSAGASFVTGLRVLLVILLFLAVLAFPIWLVFFKRWGGDPNS
jgi:hypothetical protein